MLTINYICVYFSGFQGEVRRCTLSCGREDDPTGLRGERELHGNAT